MDFESYGKVFIYEYCFIYQLPSLMFFLLFDKVNASLKSHAWNMFMLLHIYVSVCVCVGACSCISLFMHANVCVCVCEGGWCMSVNTVCT